jgi:hypothetical protein
MRAKANVSSLKFIQQMPPTRNQKKAVILSEAFYTKKAVILSEAFYSGVEGPAFVSHPASPPQMRSS